MSSSHSDGGATRCPAVGNDVVDRADPRLPGKSGDDRFLRRIFERSEARAISRADDPDLELWTRWACKEAAFKVASKVRGAPPVFRHSAFVTALEDSVATLRRGIVRYDGLDVTVEVRLEADMLHAVAWADVDNGGRGRGGGGDAPGERATAGLRAGAVRLEAYGGATLAELLGRFTAREADAVHGLASAAVRLAARAELAAGLDLAEGRLEIVCPPGPTGRRPPSVYLDGAPAEGIDLSLSHAGDWLAWAWIDEGAAGRGGVGAP